MTNMFEPDWDPLSKILELEGTVLVLAEQFEDIQGKLVNATWLLEEAAKQINHLTKAVNKLHERQLEQLRRIHDLEAQQ